MLQMDGNSRVEWITSDFYCSPSFWNTDPRSSSALKYRLGERCVAWTVLIKSSPPKTPSTAAQTFRSASSGDKDRLLLYYITAPRAIHNKLSLFWTPQSEWHSTGGWMASPEQILFVCLETIPFHFVHSLALLSFSLRQDLGQFNGFALYPGNQSVTLSSSLFRSCNIIGFGPSWIDLIKSNRP